MDKGSSDNLGNRDPDNEQELMDRRGFFSVLKKWSKIVIGGAILGSALLEPGTQKEADAARWINGRYRGGGAWANRIGGGGAWANRAGGGGAWANRRGGGGAWVNRGAGWINRGGGWINRF